ncbi:MAG: hypothetical protein ACLGHQ_11560, partial [Acidimicrobiia bacterium]
DATAVAGEPVAPAGTDDSSSGTGPDASAPDGSDITAPASTDSGATTTFAVVEVPETGVPGLDSPDAFCAAWSRFGGSWQVIQVAANFTPDPTIVPALEVVAAPVVAEAYETMFAAWPEQLADEREVVADGFFGPLDRRAAVALDALATAGASDTDLDAIAAAWEAALAVRRPDEPVVRPELPDELWALVDAAAADFDGRLVGFVADPSMLITVDTPATDTYLATACPDQGALTGADADG